MWHFDCKIDRGGVCNDSPRRFGQTRAICVREATKSRRTEDQRYDESRDESSVLTEERSFVVYVITIC